MIVVKILGGLGNQLFQYAFGKAIENKTGNKVYYDVKDLKTNYKLRKFSIAYFNVKIDTGNECDMEALKSSFNKIVFKIYQLSGGRMIPKRKLKYYSQTRFLFDETVFSLSDNVYLNGYWQSERYFNDIKELIKSEFTLLDTLNADKLIISKQIDNSNSVSIHIRRGDYINVPANKKLYHSCSLQYYEDAINYISARLANPLFFIFSDDISWAKDNLNGNYNLVFMNPGNEDYEDLTLMSRCKHNIIANSTFSWWAAWLNSADDKMVIAPKQWFVNNSRSTVDLLPQNWITL